MPSRRRPATQLTVDAARGLRRWFVAVGVFYLVLGLRLLPWINGPMIERFGLGTVYLGDDLEVGDTAFAYLLDWMGAFGLDLLVLGGVLLVASRRPVRNRLLAHLVIWHELTVGVLADLWFVSRDYVPDGFYLGFVVVHLVVVVTGVRSLRRAPAATASDTSAVPGGSGPDARSDVEPEPARS